MAAWLSGLGAGVVTRRSRVQDLHPAQRSKVTFLKKRLLATFNCKMVAIKRNSVAKRKLGSGGHFMTNYTKT